MKSISIINILGIVLLMFAIPVKYVTVSIMIMAFTGSGNSWNSSVIQRQWGKGRTNINSRDNIFGRTLNGNINNWRLYKARKS